MREPRFSGIFYPSDSVQLEHDVSTYLNKVIVDDNPSIRGIIAPHAGYMYSGYTAAHSFKAIQNNHYRTALILGPSHRFSFWGASIYNGDGYTTPLGHMVMAKDIVTSLQNSSLINSHPKAHCEEHSIEVLLPFLKLTQGSIPIVPIIVGQYDTATIQELSCIIGSVLDLDETLIIVSSDFSHYVSEENALQMNERVIKTIRNRSSDQLIEQSQNGLIELCGLGPVLLLFELLKNSVSQHSQHLHFSHSGLVTGDKHSVVGYNAMTFY